MTRLIVNADDFGLTLEVSRGISELIAAGAVSSTSVMATAEDVERAIAEHGGGPVASRAGVHLQITGATAPLTRGGSIVDSRTGTFHSHPLPREVDPEDVRREWQAQIERVGELFGRTPSHLDTHHGYHRDPRFAQAYLDLAREYGLPVRAGAPGPAPAGVRTPDRTIRGWTTKGLPLEALLATVDEAGLDENEIAEVVTHPGYADASLRDISSLNDERERELAELRRLPSALEDRAWTLATHADL
jgi:chitin disaccharide deacetylase